MGVDNQGLVDGRVLVKESGIGVIDAIVTAFASPVADHDNRRRLGSDATDEGGNFSIQYPSYGEPPDTWDLLVTVSSSVAESAGNEREILAEYWRRQPEPREYLILKIEHDALTESGLVDDLRLIELPDEQKQIAEDLESSRTVRETTDTKFQQFTQALTDADGGRSGGRYVAEGGDVKDSVIKAVQAGVTERIEPTKVTSFMSITSDRIDELRPKYNDLTGISADEFKPAGSVADPIARAHYFFDPIAYCRRQTPINDCVKLLAPQNAEHNHVHPPDERVEPVAPGAAPGVPAVKPAEDETISELVGRLTRTMSPPESSVVFGVRPGVGDVQASVDGLSLRSGPADIPATYDFHRLEIAFESVWQELFDRRLLEAGKELYDTFVELGLDPNKYLIDSSGKPSSRRTKRLGKRKPKGGPPPEVIQWFQIAPREWDALLTAYQSGLQTLGKKLNGLEEKYSVENQLLGPPVLPGQELDSSAAERKERTLLIAQGERIIKYARELLQAPQEFEKLHSLMEGLEKSLKEPYRFNVYAANNTGRSINFGIIATYRQRWTPLDYQVGELVRTVPLAPKESRKYTRKTIRKLSRAQKESTSRLESLRSESSVTARVESEIIARAQTKTNFHVGAEAGIDMGITLKGTASFGRDAEQSSQETKKEFREAVFKSAAEYKSEYKLEVDVSESSEYTDEESGELSNPNDELPVTYLFYELQRRYRIDEKIRKVTPVVLVAQEIPRPDEIDDDWIVAHDWILRRVILDESFIPAMNYLATKVVGDEYALKQMYENLQQQRRIVDQLTEDLVLLRSQLDLRYDALQGSLSGRADALQQESDEGLYESIGEFFFGSGDPDPEVLKAREDAARDAYQRVLGQGQELSARIARETTALAEITDKYTSQLADHLNRRTQITRLRVHIKGNILHYMQAIYSHEPPDQRYFRLHDVKVPRLVGKKTYSITTDLDAIPQPPTWTKPHKLTAQVEIDTKKLKFDLLGDVADLDNPLGFKGNYMMFPLTRENALTDFMLTPYYDPFTGLRDPESLANWTLHDFAEYVCCLHENSTEFTFGRYLPGLIETYRRLKERDNDDSEMAIPTGSLYIEALPGVHPLLEDFKLAHRAIDVKKAQADARLTELENLRMAARLLANEHEDPRVDKKIVIEGMPGIAINPDDI